MEANLRAGRPLLPGTSTNHKCRRLVEKWNLIRMNGLEKINKSAIYMKVVKIKDIYKIDEPIIPEGYEAIDFRSPRDGELFIPEYVYDGMHPVSKCNRHSSMHMWTDADMRIIVRKKPKEFTDTEILETILPWLNSCVPSGYLIGGKGWTSKPLLLNSAAFSEDWRGLKKAIIEKMRADYENGNVNGAKE